VLPPLHSGQLPGCGSWPSMATRHLDLARAAWRRQEERRLP
jgi:hypothetical protein